MKTPRPLQDTAQGQVRPWEGFRIIPEVDREATWLKVCENKEAEASHQRMANLERQHRELVEAGDGRRWKVLRKIDKERQFQIKHGFIRLPLEGGDHVG